MSKAQRWQQMWAATLLLLLAASLRLVALHTIPPGLSQDEVLDADIAEGILAGRHALFFQEGFGHEPLYHYYAAPLQKLLGDNVLGIRLPSVWLGLLVIALAWRWARRDHGPWAAATVAAGLAVSWWPIVFSRLGIRPIAEAVGLLLAALAWFRHPGLAGLALGLTLYTYTPATVMLALPALLALHAWVQARRGALRPGEPGPGHHLLILAIAGLVYAPLFLYLRANPALLERLNQIGGPLAALQAGDWRPVWQASLATLGVFGFTGDPRWTYMWPGRPVFDPILGLVWYFVVILTMRRFGEARYALLLLWLAVALTPSALTADAPSPIRLIGALPVVYLLPGVALQSAAGRYPRLWLGVALMVATGWTLGRTLTLHFNAWPQQFETRLKYQTIFLEMAQAIRATPLTPVVADGFFEPIDADSLRRNLGADPQTRWVQAGAALVFPADRPARLYVPESDPLQPALLEAGGLSAEPLYRALTPPGFAVYALPSAPSPPLALSPPAAFGGQLTLLGYQALPHRPDAPLELITYWQVEAPLAADVALFLHAALVDAPAASPPVTQHDGLDAIPATLHPGDRFLQYHRLSPPSAAGAYQLTIGVYQRATGQRLRLPNGQDTLPLPLRPTWNEPDSAKLDPLATTQHNRAIEHPSENR